MTSGVTDSHAVVRCGEVRGIQAQGLSEGLGEGRRGLLQVFSLVKPAPSLPTCLQGPQRAARAQLGPRETLIVGFFTFL